MDNPSAFRSLTGNADLGNRSTNLPAPPTAVKRYSDDLETCIREAYQAALSLGRRTVREAHRCGHLLIEAKGRTEHGDWLPLLLRVGIAARTATRMMRLARRYKSAEVGRFASVESAERALLPAPATATGTEAELQAEISRLQDGQRAMEEQSTELDATIARLERRCASALVAAASDPKRMECYAEAQLTTLKLADSRRAVAERQTAYEAERRRAVHYKRLLKQHGVDVTDPDLWMQTGTPPIA